MNFEEHMRNWCGYENEQLYLDPDTHYAKEHK